MRNDGSIALTKLNMSVIDPSELISAEALLCASFAQQMIDKSKSETPFIPYSELEYLDEGENAAEGIVNNNQVKLNYDLTFKMVVSHLQALEKETESRRSSEEKTLTKEIEKERKLLEKSLRILERNTVYKSSPVVRSYREKLALRELGRRLSETAGSEREKRYSTEGLKLIEKYNSPDVIRLLTNEAEIRTLRNQINKINEINRNLSKGRNIFISTTSGDYGNSSADGQNRYDISEPEGIGGSLSVRNAEETAKSIKRVMDRQVREIKSLRDILSKSDLL